MDQEKTAGLFQEFPPVSTQQWEEKIHEDLKGADYEKKLIWKTIEGLKIRPYYRAEDLEKLAHMHALPGEAPFVRGGKTRNNDWEIRQDIDAEDPEKANATALKALAKGAEAVGLNAGEVASAPDLAKLIENIDPAKTPVHFNHGKNFPQLAEWLVNMYNQEARGSFNFDPLGYFVLYNKFYETREANVEQAAELLKLGKERLPKFKTIAVNGQHFHNAGASLVQELAFALAQGNEYLAALTEKGFGADDIANRMTFTLAVGSNYFLEIAKLRAARLLWAKIVEQYQPVKPESLKMTIHAVTSSWNKSIYDPYVNMLRTTTEAMAAAIGGADSMTVQPFDSTYKKSDDFSDRIARNQQIVLKYEAYFNKVSDPAAGSYYVENLTHSIAEAAWNLFVEVEEQGGFITSVEKRFIQEQIQNTCQQRDMDIAMRKQVFVGVNQYPNLNEEMLDKLQPIAKLTDLAGLRPYRGVQAFEALRLAVENHKKKGFEVPKVFLLTYGNLTMRKARASFSTNFFGVAGYQIIDNPGFQNIEEGVQAAIDQSADIVVLCSSDEEYADMAPAATIIKEKSPKTQVVVAGYPKELLEQLDQAGVDHYIHMRTDLLQALTHF
ncbi:MAG: acyl-CoA mutase large subunit family protein, partial [Bacteroidales bacterium]|nr:acyl-CoA mutase large subunit family protein [Bacteroidales bacterium]